MTNAAAGDPGPSLQVIPADECHRLLADVTFHVDELDRSTRSGWSVLVRGLAEEVGAEHRDDLVARTHAAGAQPWAPGEHGNGLRLIPHPISWRRIVPGQLPPPVDPRGYL